MKLIFIGTRGLIEARTRLHGRHTALLACYRGRRVMVDCGPDWIDDVHVLRPDAMVITHPHEDHVDGLAKGAPCPVWATEAAWERMAKFPIAEKRVLRVREPETIEGIGFEAFDVEHSVTHHTVGYRIGAGRAAVFYSPDLIYIHEREEALKGVQAYIGDGASLKIPMVQRRGERLIGHAPIKTQIGWCAREGVPRCIISHCGNEVVAMEPRAIAKQVAAWGEEKGVTAEIAVDGMELTVR